MLQRAYEALQNCQDMRRQLALGIARVKFLFATEKSAAAEKQARQVFAQARKLGLFRLELEAGLALGESMKTTNPPAARAQLEEVAKKAKAKGFGLLARAAAAATAQR